MINSIDLDKTRDNLVHRFIAPITDPRYCAQCSLGRLIAVESTCAIAPGIASSILNNSWTKSKMIHFVRCESEFRRVIYEYFVQSLAHNDPEHKEYTKARLARLDFKMAPKGPYVVRRPCPCCGAKICIPHNGEITDLCYGCGSQLHVIHKKKGMWDLNIVEGGGGAAMPSSLQECYDILDVPMGASLAAIQDGFCWKFILCHPARIRWSIQDDPIVKHAEMLTSVLTHAVEQVRANL